MAADSDLDAGDILHLPRECVSAFRPVDECNRRHSHHQIVRCARHHATHGVEDVGGDDVGAGAEAFIAHSVGVGREDAAVMVGHTGRSHGVEIGLNPVLVDGPNTPNLRRQPNTSVTM